MYVVACAYDLDLHTHIVTIRIWHFTVLYCTGAVGLFCRV